MREAITSMSPAMVGVSWPEPPWLPPSTTRAAPMVEAASAIQPSQSEPLASIDGGSGGKQHRHGAHHERSVAYRGDGEAVELQQELDRDAECGGDEQQAHLPGGEAHTVEERNRQNAERGKEEAVKHHVFDAHLIEREATEVEPGAPQGAGQRAGSIAQKSNACVCWPRVLHTLFNCRIPCRRLL